MIDMGQAQREWHNKKCPYCGEGALKMTNGIPTCKKQKCIDKAKNKEVRE